MPAGIHEHRTAVELVRNFRKLRALVIGDAMLDSYFEGSAARLCSEGPVPVVRKTSEQRIPGGAANTAANLRALGADVYYLGVLGTDPAGRLLRGAMQDAGVDGRWIVVDESVTTTHKLRILADGQYVVRFDDGEMSHYSSEIERRVLANLERAFSRCNVVVVSDYGYGVVSDAVIERLLALRDVRSVPLVVDAKNLRRYHHAGASVATPNLLEARLAVNGVDPYSSGHLDMQVVERLAADVLEIVDAEHVALTLSADGVYLLDRQGQGLHLPAHPVQHANVAGAGDSFAAALALSLAAGAGIAEAARIGNDAAGIAVTKRWTSVVRHQELLQRVSLRYHATAAEAAVADGLLHGVAQLAERLDAERRAGRTIVFTNGVFDILHAGHVGFLRRAKSLGDLLVVGINSDRSARRLKGENRPINSERDRLALVAALDPVDHVILFDEDEPSALIRALHPHLHVKGADYADEVLPEADAVREVGGSIVILPLLGDVSTSSVIERIIALAGSSGGAQ